jgi:hypothetical protein
MPYDRQIPDAPIALSMLPRVAAADIKSQDILVLTQPGNPIGQKNKSLTLQTLSDSDVFRLQGVRNAITKSNILEYTGALAETSAVSNYTEICHLDIHPLLDVEFHVWGSSNPAGDAGDTYNVYNYGLRGKTRQLYLPDDQDRELVAFSPSGFRNSDETGPSPVYNATFGLYPINYDPSASELAAHPTKRVTLFLSSGTSGSPYHATHPSQFSLSIQATIYPSKYVTGILQATESP